MSWYDRGKEQLLARIAKEVRIDVYTMELIYGMLDDSGLIDYDIEKEVFQREVENGRRLD